MDAQRFEDFLRVLSASPTRRGIARVAIGFTLAGSIGSLLGFADADAKKKRKKKRKKKKRQPACSAASCRGCCDGTTCYEGDSENSCGRGGVTCAACGAGEACDAGACVCEHECCADSDCPAPSGMICSDYDCRCPSGQGQTGGVCGTLSEFCYDALSLCQTNEQCCSGDCVPGQGDLLHCLPSEVGEKCKNDLDCAEGAFCKGFVCAPPSQAGGPCSSDFHCEAGLHCVDYVCVTD